MKSFAYASAKEELAEPKFLLIFQTGDENDSKILRKWIFLLRIGQFRNMNCL
jgi:hypothetical protein